MAAPKLTLELAPGSTLPAALASGSYVALVGAVAALYILAARAGLGLNAVSGFASLVWAPSGIALAALVLGGRRFWPGVFLGALVANALTGANALVAAGIATGNTLEAVAGAYALSRMPGFQPALDRVRDALAVIVFAAMLSTAIGATIGIMTLYFGGLVAPGAGLETWGTWWVGMRSASCSSRHLFSFGWRDPDPGFPLRDSSRPER